MLTERDHLALETLARYFLMTRVMIQEHCYLTDHDGRLTRRRLSALCRDEYVRKQTLQVVNPRDNVPSPVYTLAARGRQFLAEHFADDSFLHKPTAVSRPHHMLHYLAVAQTHILLDRAVAQSPVDLVAWFHEDEIVNAEEPDSKKHFKLFTEIQKHPKLVAAPDAAFLLDVHGHRGVFYVEQDRARDNYSHKRTAALKSPGYCELYARGLHRRHFPTTTFNRFTVIMIAPHEKRRDALRRAFAKKDGANLWCFASMTDLTPKSLLHAPVWFRADDEEPEPLVRMPSESSQSTEEQPCQE